MKRAFATLAAAAACAAASAAPWNSTLAFTEVSPRGVLSAGPKDVRFCCADLGGFLPEDEAGAVALAGRLWAAGFDMVRTEALAAPESPDAPEGPGDAAANAFVAACRALGVRIWAEALAPSSALPFSAGDVALVDDPSTADAWTNAVSEALSAPDGAERLALAAAWDPRLEVALQRRVRAWGRAFNPRTGLRRCEDPVFAVFSFSSRWLDEMTAPDRGALPEFFEESLREWWGNWLYDRYGGDEKAAAALGPLLPGETVASNTVAFPPIDPADTNRTAAFRSEQRLFLHNLDVDHLKRVVEPFSMLGRAARVSPRVVCHSEGRAISALSTAACAPARHGGSASAQPSPSEPAPPVLWRCAAGADFAAEARAAAAAGASAFAVPVDGPDLPAAADAAAVFRAGPDAPAPASPDGSGGTDSPSYARASGEFAVSGETNAVAAAVSFPRFGAEIRFVCGRGSRARLETESMLAASNAAPVSLVVHISPGRFSCKAVLRRDEPSGALVFGISVSDAETGEPCKFGVLAGGPGLAKRSLSLLPAGEDPPKLPDGGFFTAETASGEAILVFRPAIVAPAILRTP